MRTRPGLAAAAAAALIWWVWPDEAARAPVGPGSGTGPAPAVAAARGEPAPPDRNHGPPVAVHASPFAERDGGDAGAVEPPTIAVMLKDLDGQPVAGAEVLVMDPVVERTGALTGNPVLDLLEDPASPLPRGLGPIAVSDAAGCARPPAWPGSAQVFARRGALAGRTVSRRIDDGIEHVDVTMFPAESLDVRVVDAGNRPLGGIPVAFRESGQDWRRDRQRAVTEPRNGRARIGWAPQAIRLERAGQEFAVALAFPLPAPVEAPLDPLHPPSGPLTLACPPTGSVVVEVVDGAGKPASDGTVVRLGPDPENARDLQFGTCSQEVKDGRTTFPIVGLGLELAAQIGNGTRSSFRGPMRAGESVRVLVRQDVRRFVIRGRLLREDRSPRRGAVLGISSGPDPSWMARTGPDGRFEAQATHRAGRTFVGTLELWIASDQRAASVVVPWEGGPNPAGLDLGDVVVPDLPLVATGEVVDAAGQPVAHAWVDVMQPDDESGPEGGWFAEMGFPSTTTDSRGRFELFGTAPGAAHLCASDAGHTTRFEPVPLAGPGPYRLFLRAPAKFTARLSAPAGFPFRRVHAGLWPESQGEPGPIGGRGWHSTEVKADGSSVATRLDPGGYTFGIHAGTDEAAVLIPGIRIGAGPENRDARLDPLDLGGVFRLIRLRVRDDSGRTLRADAHAIFEDGTVTQLGRADGALVIARRKPLATVIVAAEGTFARSLGPIEGEHEVTLARGIAVPMAWPADVPLPAAPVVIRVSLEPETDDPGIPGGRKAADCLRRWSASLADLPAGGRVELRAPAPGAFRIRLVARKECGGWTDERDITPDPPPLVAVTDPAPSTPLPIPLDPALLDRALATLGKQ